MASKERLVILGASKLQIPAIIEAKNMGLETVVVDWNPNAPGFNFADIVVNESTRDVEKVMKAAVHYGVSGIMTMATDFPMRTVAKVASSLGLPGISEECAMKATDKGLMRECLSKAGLPCPEFYRMNTFEEFRTAVSKMNYNCIAKPTDSSGSHGVFKISEPSEMELAFNSAKQNSGCGDILVEEYIEGHEISVETITTEGNTHVVAITDKITTGPPRFVETGHSQPSMLTDEIIKEITSTVEGTVRAVGIHDGVSHTELKIGPNGPKIIEIGARLGGDFIASHLVPLSTGINLVEVTIRLALGQKVQVRRLWNKGAAIKYLSAPPGRLVGIEGVEKMKQVPGIVEYEILKKVGDTIPEVYSSADRIGYVIASAKNAAEALNTCKIALDKVLFRVQ